MGIRACFNRELRHAFFRQAAACVSTAVWSRVSPRTAVVLYKPERHCDFFEYAYIKKLARQVNINEADGEFGRSTIIMTKMNGYPAAGATGQVCLA
mgnify:CR=1 FL=1